MGSACSALLLCDYGFSITAIEACKQDRNHVKLPAKKSSRGKRSGQCMAPMIRDQLMRNNPCKSTQHNKTAAAEVRSSFG